MYKLASGLETDHQSFKMPFTVTIEGNIGSGKSTFLEHFRHNDAIRVVEEPVKLWQNVAGVNLLDRMYKDAKRNAFLFQSYAQLTMLQNYGNVGPSSLQRPIKVMERSLYSTRLFIEHLSDSGILAKEETEVLCQWHRWIMLQGNVRTDLIIYLRTDPQIAMERIKQRNRSEESGISLKYIQDIHHLHEDWLIRRSILSVPCPVIVLDANRNKEDMCRQLATYYDAISKGDLTLIKKNVNILE